MSGYIKIQGTYEIVVYDTHGKRRVLISDEQGRIIVPPGRWFKSRRHALETKKRERNA